MTLFPFCQMINDVDSVFRYDGRSREVTGTLLLTSLKGSVSEASPAGLLCPNNQEATYLQKESLTHIPFLEVCNKGQGQKSD